HTRFSRDWSSDVCSSDLNPSGNFTLGTGGVQSANYYKLGKLVVMLASFTLGTSGNILGGTTPVQISLPFAAGPRGFVAARARSRSDERRVGREWRSGVPE